MDKKLLDVLCCPVSHVPLRMLDDAELQRLNRAIAAGSVDTVTGEAVTARLAEGLITTDQKVVYRVTDGIPILLPEEGIGTTQLDGAA